MNVQNNYCIYCNSNVTATTSSDTESCHVTSNKYHTIFNNNDSHTFMCVKSI